MINALLDIWYMMPGSVKWIILAGVGYLATSVLLATGYAALIMVVLWGAAALGFAYRSGRLPVTGFLESLLAGFTNAPPSTSLNAATGGAQPAASRPAAPPGGAQAAPPSLSRKDALTHGTQIIDRLLGNGDAKRRIQDLVNLAHDASQRGRKGFGVRPPATLVLFYGPSGVGKSDMARAFALLFYAYGGMETPKMVRLRGRQIMDAGPGGAGQLAEQQALAALDGVLLIDDAEWLAGGRGHSGSDFAVEVGRAFLHVAEAHPDRLFIVATGRESFRNKLRGDNNLESAWLKKVNVEEVPFEPLSTDELFEMFRGHCENDRVRLDTEIAPFVRRAIKHMQERDRDQFANAYAIQTLFDKAAQPARLRSSGREAIFAASDFDSVSI